LKEIKIPLICHFTNKDDWCTPGKVNDLEAALKQSKSESEIYRYEAHHAFMNEAAPRSTTQHAPRQRGSERSSF
jgi:carboxymethylenebutenolidase